MFLSQSPHWASRLYQRETLNEPLILFTDLNIYLVNHVQHKWHFFFFGNSDVLYRDFFHLLLNYTWMSELQKQSIMKVHVTSAQHLPAPIHPSHWCHLSFRQVCSLVTNQEAPLLCPESTPPPLPHPHHQMWLTASHKKKKGGGLFTSPCSLGTKLMMPANKIIKKK